MSKFKWTYLTPNVEIWWDGRKLDRVAEGYFRLSRSKYHRADGPSVKVGGNFYVWWLNGLYYGQDIQSYIIDNNEVSDINKALMILEWL